MHRIDTVFDVTTQIQTDIPFTDEEEAARDIEESQVAIEIAAEQERQDRRKLLEDKLTDDNIIFNELKELMRLRG